MALYITNNAHTFSVNETQYVGGQAEQYSSTTNKNDIIDDFFYKINELSDKKGEVKAKNLYNKIIKKIDSIISKTKSSKKKKLLEYIKVKFEEKVK